MNRLDSAIAKLGSVARPTRAHSAAVCRCGSILHFTTDGIGRTVEQCGGCGYEGGVRRVGHLVPPTLPRKRKKSKRVFNPLAFPCGHPRSLENTAHNRRGWSECRECGRARAKRSRRTAA